MAARSDAATDRISLASAPSMAALTVCGWFKINSASAGSFNTIWRFSLTSGDGTTWILAFRGTNGRTPTLYSPSNTTGIAGAEVALGTYVFLCATLNGTAAQLFYGSEPGGSLTKVTGTVAAGTTDRLTVFGRSPSDASDALLGDASYLRIWQRVLSDAEVAAESQATSPASSTSIWGNWAFAAAALTDSVASRNFTAGSTPLSSVADPSLGGSTNASMSIGTTAGVSLGAFATRAGSVTIGATAQLVTSPQTTRPASAPIATTAQVSAGAFADRAGAVNIAATAQLSTTPVRTTSAAVTVATTSQLGLVPLADRTAALGVTSTAQIAVNAATDRAAALQVAATAAVSVAPSADRAGAVIIATASRLDLVPVLEHAGALTIATQAVVTALPGGALPAALAVGVTAQLTVAAVRTTPAALDVATVAAVLLSSAVEHPAALAVATQAQLDLSTERQLAGALAIAAVARLGLVVEGQVTGSLLLQVGEGRPVEWLKANSPDTLVVMAAGAPTSASWLSSGAGRPA